jgi:hypothetical protein
MEKKKTSGEATMAKPKPKLKTPTAKRLKGLAKREQQMERLQAKKPYLFKLTKSYPNNTVNRLYPPRFIIKGIDIIYDAATGMQRQIRYAPGEKSIFVDEQSDNVKIGNIVFINGQLMVKKTQPLLYQFLMASNRNEGNPNRDRGVLASFMLVDDDSSAKDNLANAEKQIEAMNIVFNISEDKLLAHAMILGVDINRPIEQVKFDLKVKAEANPVKFIKDFNDPKAEKKYHVLLAEDYDIIGHDHYQYYWKRGREKDVIVNIPIGKSPVDYFVDFLYEKDGEAVYSQILKQLEE